MRHPLFVAALAVLLCSCGPDSKPSLTESPKKAPAPKPADESRRLPKTNLVQTELVDKELMGKTFMPGGTLGRYKKGGVEYQIFVAKLPAAGDAALLLPDWRAALTGPKLIPSFGGYFGQDAGRPLFVFSKGAWIAGVAGLPEKEADLQARTLAALLP
ncbi:MAG TPA: hypothetical protein VM120_22705 [Bryobacteraceae bacterium]|nr:hypothetical protein [Bryobacteraceae bacterium]